MRVSEGKNAIILSVVFVEVTHVALIVLLATEVHQTNELSCLCVQGVLPLKTPLVITKIKWSCGFEEKALISERILLRVFEIWHSDEEYKPYTIQWLSQAYNTNEKIDNQRLFRDSDSIFESDTSRTEVWLLGDGNLHVRYWILVSDSNFP